MKILFITRLFYPHVGGVEKHVFEVSKNLIKMGHDVTVLTEKYCKEIKEVENIEGIKVIRFSHGKIKYFGLVGIWFWIFGNRKHIKRSNIVHCHDTFIWYFPFRFLYPHKEVITTIHGLEWDSPLRPISIWQKRVTIRLSSASVGIGKFLEKYLGVKFNLISYGASIFQKTNQKNSDSIVYVGRLEENTGILNFLKWLDENPNCKVDFCGDGNLRDVCKKYGAVHGFTNPNHFYKNAKYCVPGGYLAALEALNSGCELKLFWNNKVKEDYWKMSLFYKLKGRKLKDWARKQTWGKLTSEYLDLYRSVLNEKH